jgi:hypothetical protein
MCQWPDIFTKVLIKGKSQGTSFGIATGYWMDDQMTWVRVPAGVGSFLFTTVSRPAVGPTQPSIQWVPEALSWGKAAEA